MRVFVIGTGSVGLRHIQNLFDLGCDVYAYSYRGRVPQLNSPFTPRLVASIEDGWLGNPDALVIASTADKHLQLAVEAAHRGIHVYVEKPLSVSLSGVDTLTELVNEKSLVVETGFMLRHHPNLLWIRKYIDQTSLRNILYLRASVGQWLPDWRPGTHYHLSYSADHSKGGGVIFDLIHELDLIQWLGGSVQDLSAMAISTPLLEINTEAVAQILLRLNKNVLAQVHLDYVRPCLGRTLEIALTDGVLHWDYARGLVTLSTAEVTCIPVHECPNDFERNHMFLRAMEHFLRRIRDPTTPPVSSLEDGISALRLALACYASVSQRCNIRPSEIA